jgi:hypothetical protein
VKPFADCLDLAILKSGMAQDTVRRRFGVFGEIENAGVDSQRCSCVLSLFRFFRQT